MTTDGTATLPSLLCDGATTARPVGPVRSITPAVEGAHAFVVVGGDGYAPAVWRWHLDDGALERWIDDVGDETAVAADGSRALWTTDGGATMRWRGRDGTEGSMNVAPQRPHPCCTPDGRFAGAYWKPADRDGRSVVAWVWIGNVTRGAKLAQPMSAAGMVFTDDGRYAATVRDDASAVVFTSLPDGAVTEVPLGSPTAVRQVVAERGGGRVVVEATPLELAVVDPHRREVQERIFVDAEATLVDFAAGRIVTQERVDRRRRVVRALDAGDERVLSGNVDAVGPLTRDGTRMLRWRPPVLEVVDVARGTTTKLHDGHDTAVRALAWSRDGATLATLAVGGAVRLWDVADASLRWELEDPIGGAEVLAFSADGQCLFTLGPKALVVWDVARGQERSRHAALGRRVSSMAVSPDGQHLAAAGPDGIVTVADPVGAARVVGSTWGDVRGSVTFTAAGDRVRFLSGVWTPPTYRLSRVAARWCDLTLRGPVEESSRPIEPWGGLFPVEDDDALGVQVRDGALEVAELRDEARVRRVPVGEGAERVLACAGGAAVVDVVARRDGRIDGHRLVVVGMHDEVLRGAVRLTRRPLLAALSPDATRLAVAYVDGGVEVFGVPARAAG